jgi:FkbM family methyltransferase
MLNIKNKIKNFLKILDIGITRYSELERLRKNPRAAYDLEFILTLPNEHSRKIVQFLNQSKSQIRQDLFVLSELDFKKNGFFVEFGATNGIDLSNTYLLEKEFGWRGILAEPGKCWHTELGNNRSAAIDHNCVWKNSSSTLMFNEVEVPELSTINAYSGSDLFKGVRTRGEMYEVKSISLADLLKKHGAPNHIDYLSIDTEGSEYEILNNFDFEEYSFDVITCEHNFTPLRDKIFELLSKKGYQRKYQSLSDFDDWYVKAA